MMTIMATETTVLKSKVLPALGHAAATAAVYIAVKHFTRGLETRDVWVAIILAVGVAVVASLPWRMRRSAERKADDLPKGD